MFYEETERRRLAAGRRRLYPCRECKRKTNTAAQAPRRRIVDEAKAKAGCLDCGLKLPDNPEVFDFDHRPGEAKVRSVAASVTSGTVSELLDEMSKCDIVCANCHRIRTKLRGSKLRPPKSSV